MTIERVVRYNVEVYADLEMDNLRRERCLCLNCSEISNCSTAKELLDYATKKNIAFMVTRCPVYSK